MSRKLARENTYLLVFEYLFNKEFNQTTMDILFMDGQLSDDDKKYITTTYEGVIAHFDDIVKLISDNTLYFNLERIYKPDLAALILSTYELKYVKDIPVSVAINEGVAIAKKFSTEKSGSFVNGILSKINMAVNGEKNENN